MDAHETWCGVDAHETRLTAAVWDTGRTGELGRLIQSFSHSDCRHWRFPETRVSYGEGGCEGSGPGASRARSKTPSRHMLPESIKCRTAPFAEVLSRAAKVRLDGGAQNRGAAGWRTVLPVHVWREDSRGDPRVLLSSG